MSRTATISTVRHCIMKPFQVLVIPCYTPVQESLTVDAIIDKVCEHYEVPKRTLVGKSQRPDYVEARFVAMYLIRTLMPKVTQTCIGLLFNRHHTTVIHALTTVINRLRVERLYREKFDALKCELQQMNRIKAKHHHS